MLGQHDSNIANPDVFYKYLISMMTSMVWLSRARWICCIDSVPLQKEKILLGKTKKSYISNIPRNISQNYFRCISPIYFLGPPLPLRVRYNSGGNPQTACQPSGRGRDLRQHALKPWIIFCNARLGALQKRFGAPGGSHRRPAHGRARGWTFGDMP